jgi:hypothetical protein
MYSSFKKLFAIKENRTPRTLRIFLGWALVAGVLILSPQFAILGLYGIFTSLFNYVLPRYIDKSSKNV